MLSTSEMQRNIVLYNSFMDQSYLNLGDMLTFVGLVIAGYQIMKPRYLLTWKLSNNLIKTLAVTLLIIGYFAPLTAILVPNADGFWQNFTRHQTIQILGFVCITAGLLCIAYIYSALNRSHLIIVLPKYKLHFVRYPKEGWRTFTFHLERHYTATTRSAKKFYEVTSRFLVRGHIEEVVEIMHYNLKPLITAAHQFAPKYLRFDDDKEEPSKPTGSSYAYETLIQLLTDDVAMKHISTTDRPFLHGLLWQESNYSGLHHGELSDAIYTNVVRHLAINPGSFLYTQKDIRNGSARFGNLYEHLTDNKIITRRQIIPGQLTWTVSNTNVPLDEYADALLKLLELMVNKYKQHPGHGVLLNNIQRTLDALFGDMSGVTRVMAYNKDIPVSVKKSFLLKLYSSLTSILPKDDDPDTFKNNKANLEATNQKHTFDYDNLVGLLAHKVYDLIEDLTVLFHDADNRDEELRQTVHSFIGLWADTAVSHKYQQLLWERLLDKAIDGKLELASNLQGFYPNVLRFVIYYLAPRTSFADRDKATADARDRLLSVMDHELKEALLAGKEMANYEPMKDVLLPSNIKATISKRNKTVKYYLVNDRGKQKLIDLKNKTTVNKSAKKK